MELRNYVYIAIIGLAILIPIFFLFTPQTRVKHFGGTIEIKIDKGYKLVEATWKDSQLWYLTEPVDSNYTPKTKLFIESSRLGVLEGKVIFKEQ